MDPTDNGVTQGMRFKDVPTAMSYTLIHLSGDYPLLDYTLTGKFICFLMCIFAASVVQVSLSLPPPSLSVSSPCFRVLVSCVFVDVLFVAPIVCVA